MKKINYTILLLPLLFLGACKKNDQLQSPEDSRVNFFNATNYPTPFIGIDKPVSNTAPLQFVSNTYPNSSPGANYEIGLGAISYTALTSGSHHFYFADTAKTLRAEKELDMKTGTHYTLYLTDSLLKYDVVGLEENPFPQNPDRIRLRVLNLVPDAVVNTSLVTTDSIPQNLTSIKEIPYKGVSGIYELDVKDALNENFFLRFYDKQNSIDPISVATLKAGLGREYLVVLSGYNNDQVVNLTPPDRIIFRKGVKVNVRVVH